MLCVERCVHKNIRKKKKKKKKKKTLINRQVVKSRNALTGHAELILEQEDWPYVKLMFHCVIAYVDVDMYITF